MNRFFFLALTLVLFPAFAHAQTLQVFFTNTMAFINKTLIPFILGIAFLFVVINAIRYFVIEGNNEDGREKAKNLALYSVLAFAVIIVFWGVINMIASSIGLDGKSAPSADYTEMGNGGTITGGSGDDSIGGDIGNDTLGN